MIDYEDDLSIAMREMEETKEAMTEQEITQAHADISQIDIEQLRCGVMQQLLKIEALTKERNDAVYACGLVVQRCDRLVIERDALAAAGKLALDALKDSKHYIGGSGVVIDAKKACEVMTSIRQAGVQ